MKATLTFTLPEERYEYDCANRGAEYRHCLSEFDEYLRRVVKYDGDPPAQFSVPCVEKEILDLLWVTAADCIRTALRGFLQEHDLTLD